MNMQAKQAFLLCLLLGLVALTSSVHVFDVFRMVQYETVHPEGNVLHGSQRTSFTLQATTLSAEDVMRSVVIVPLHKLDLQVFDDIIAKASALLVLLPEKDQLLPASLLSKWNSIEQVIITKEVKIPVYFAYSDPQLLDLYHQLEDSSSKPALLSDTYNLAVSSVDGGAIKEVPVTNFQGWLPGAGASTAAQGEGPPTIALVAHYDTFALAPGLAVGGDSNGSGVVALLELARLFSKLYSGLRTQGNLNYAGAKHWLDVIDSRLLASIEFALCLDTIAGDKNELFFHVSRPPTDTKIARIFEDFTTTASQMGISFELVHKKINISNPLLSWEHEQFSRKRVVAATLSRHSSPKDQLSRSSILDNRAQLNTTTLLHNIRFVAESLAKYIYGLHGRELEVFAGSLSLSEDFVTSWLRVVASTPRVEAFTIDSSLLAGFERVLKDYTSEASKVHTKVTPEMIFYGDCMLQMSAHRVKSILFDALYFVVVLVYLVILFTTLKGFSDSWALVNRTLFGKL